MYEHIVLFKLTPEATPEKQQMLVNKLLAFRGIIPGIVDLSAGVNVTEETGNVHGYTLGLRVTFESLEALRAYGPHPVHQEFVALTPGLVEQVVVADYPIPEAN